MQISNDIETLKTELITYATSIFQRGLTFGASANMSVAFEGGYIVTPTNSCFGFLNREQLSVLSKNGELLQGQPASKEFLLHKAFYDEQPNTQCVIHLHSTYATALSCLADIDINDAVPCLTPYLRMRLGPIALVPYFPPGSDDLVMAVRERVSSHRGILMANHGPIVAADSLLKTVYAMEELEESCKLALLLSQQNTSQLNQVQIQYLETAYKSKL
ncbi:class II aldolase/adducin family protein [Vibrio cyclitrophicus]|uniref:class II aldolase/adducin family protein n=1 Tax=Vibrio cyclitrophicus TaxID=47951 RepID=UPI0011B372FE|nr:aldolase [Vibrio cyclitrophicus]